MRRLTSAALTTAALFSLSAIQGVALAQTYIQVAQESAPGADDFDCNILGVVRAWESAETAAAFYDYGGSNAVSCGFNWTYGPRVNASHLLFAVTTDGLSLVMLHDQPVEGNGGGGARTKVDVAGSSSPISRTVEDDPMPQGDNDTYTGAPGETLFTARNGWNGGNTDGQVLSGFSGDWSAMVQFTEAPNSLDDWEVWSQDSGWISLVLQPGRRVRLAPTTARAPNTLLALFTFDDGTYRDVSGANRHAYPSPDSMIDPVVV